jgi:hypothetical protein
MSERHPLRDAVVAMAIDGVPRKDIALRTAISERQVRALLSKARAAGVAVPYVSGYLARHDTAEPIETAHSEALQAERRRAACNGLLARLLKYHGKNPPDEDSRQAVARYARLCPYPREKRI